ncbi:nicotinamidase-like [Oppia nitens]|uniref:nicotinamidase-like n=1 Tax=Oppia nitens TaxID=1686743 RepID=UPI0023DA6A33|nr:nicotinamidase-like [Oppia nitens]
MTELNIFELHEELPLFELDVHHLDNDQRDRLFQYLDVNNNSVLTVDEFRRLFKLLFYSTKYRENHLNDKLETKLLNALNIKDYETIDVQKFNIIWEKWIKVILKPQSALVIVDVQNDFIANSGSMTVKSGQTIVPVINELIQTINFDVIVYTYDWHPWNHCSFIDSVHNTDIDRSLIETFGKNIADIGVGDQVIYEKYPKVVQHLCPKHCAQDSDGAKLYKDLVISENSMFIAKGMDPDIDSHSAFANNSKGKGSETELHNKLQQLGITDIYVTGVLYEYCVGQTAMDGLNRGYRTVIIEDAVRELSCSLKDDMKNCLIKNNAYFIKSKDVLDLVNSTVRSVQMALVLANKVFNNNNKLS